jgi:subtilisin-like proprotein convertase family protein
MFQNTKTYLKLLKLSTLTAAQIFCDCVLALGTYGLNGSLPVTIPDNNPAGVNIPITFSGLGGTASNVEFFFQEIGLCDDTVGNVKASVSHDNVGDLQFKLTSPSGTNVIFWNRRGGTRNNFCNATINSDATNPLPSTESTMGTAPIRGQFQAEPTGLLSAFNGENPNGTWVLNVSDHAAGGTGVVHWFSVLVTTPDRIDGSCGSAASTPSVLAPTMNLCGPGSIGPASATPSQNNTYEWSCVGIGGGNGASCSAPRLYSLTLNPGMGGIATCNNYQTLAFGTLTCSATPEPGFYFVGWTGDCVGDTSCVITNITANKVVNAVFSAGIAPTKSVPTLNPMALLLLIISVFSLFYYKRAARQK